MLIFIFLIINGFIIINQGVHEPYVLNTNKNNNNNHNNRYTNSRYVQNNSVSNTNTQNQ